MRVYWRIYSKSDPEWNRCGTVESVEEARLALATVMAELRYAFIGPRPLDVGSAWALEDCPVPFILAAARGW